ncbi:LptF/LptG family permease [Novacetimonas cocois]|uniref:LptF/LptG family permease n=1 Tax=Novacetimonas cocois TaxID=1747507 RepID=UPI001EF131F5|nr:LptF/LptG family permease [Novacetimonas cocois]
MNVPPFMHRCFRGLVPGTLDRYLLQQVVPPFSISLGVVMAALLLERLLALFNMLASNGSSMKTFLALLTDLVPHYLGLALPAAMCVSVFSVIRRMSQNHEIDALMASGVSMFRIARPFIIVGTILGALSFSLYGFIQPYARYDYRSALYFASHSGWAPHLQSHMFAAPSRDLMLTAEKVDDAGSRLFTVFIRDNSSHEVTRYITARKGYLYIPNNEEKIRLDLIDGTIITDRHDKSPSIIHFDHTTELFSPHGQLDKMQANRSRGQTERELTLPELYHDIRHGMPGIKHSYLVAELHFRLARTIAIPFIPFLACALAIMAKRQKRSIGLPIAAVTLVGFDHTLQMGLSLVANVHMSPLVVIWLPTLIFALGCVETLVWRCGGLRVLLMAPHPSSQRVLSPDGLPTRTQDSHP